MFGWCSVFVVVTVERFEELRLKALEIVLDWFLSGSSPLSQSDFSR